MEVIRTIVSMVNNSIIIDTPPNIKSNKFEVIVLPIDDQSEIIEWQNLYRNNVAFDFLNKSSEDIYTLNNSKPYER